MIVVRDLNIKTQMMKRLIEQVEVSKDPYYIAPQVKRMLDKSQKAVRDADQDRVFIITGPEGSGKSLLARQIAYYLDKNFCLDDICFDAEDVSNRIRNKNKFGVVVLDEGNRGLSSRSALTKINRRLIGLVQEMRQLNLFFIICIPSVFLLDKYIPLFRSHGLFHTAIYRKDYTKRYYKIYNRKNMKTLYMLGQKHMSYSKPKIHKKYRFYGKEVPGIDKGVYNKKKLDSFREEETKVPEKIRWKENFGALLEWIHHYKKQTYKDISEVLKESCKQPYDLKELSRIAIEHRKTRESS